MHLLVGFVHEHRLGKPHKSKIKARSELTHPPGPLHWSCPPHCGKDLREKKQQLCVSAVIGDIRLCRMWTMFDLLHKVSPAILGMLTLSYTSVIERILDSNNL